MKSKKLFHLILLFLGTLLVGSKAVHASGEKIFKYHFDKNVRKRPLLISTSSFEDFYVFSKETIKSEVKSLSEVLGWRFCFYERKKDGGSGARITNKKISDFPSNKTVGVNVSLLDAIEIRYRYSNDKVASCLKDVEIYAPFKEIKKQIQKNIRVAPKDQMFVVNGNLEDLKDGEKLVHNPLVVKGGKTLLRPEIRVMNKKNMYVIINEKGADGIGGKRYPVYISKGMTVAQLKGAILKIKGICKERQILNYKSNDLRPEQTMGNLSVKSGNEISLYVEKTKIGIRYLGNIDYFLLEEGATLGKLKELVAKKYGVNQDEDIIDLEKEPNLLANADDEKELIDLGVKHKDVLSLVIKQQSEDEITVTFPDDSQIVNKNISLAGLTMGELKREIEKQSSIAPENQVINFFPSLSISRELSGTDGDELRSLGVKRGQTLEVRSSLNKKVTVTIFNPYTSGSGGIIIHEVMNLSTKVQKVKEILKNAHKVSKSVEILYDGEELQDSKNLKKVFAKNKPYVLYLYDSTKEKKEDKGKLSNTFLVGLVIHFLFTAFLSGHYYMKVRKLDFFKNTEKTKNNTKTRPLTL
ncbi:MAG: ubiquitin-like protein [Bacteroidota bacterium]